MVWVLSLISILCTIFILHNTLNVSSYNNINNIYLGHLISFLFLLRVSLPIKIFIGLS